jgi:hypothetical protein
MDLMTMASKKNKHACLSCRHYRPKDVARGRCRLEKGKIDPSAYPLMNHEDCCDSWQDVGQQFHIRVGWIRGLANKTGNGPEANHDGAAEPL